jgi:hypothetical protein
MQILAIFYMAYGGNGSLAGTILLVEQIFSLQGINQPLLRFNLRGGACLYRFKKVNERQPAEIIVPHNKNNTSTYYD